MSTTNNSLNINPTTPLVVPDGGTGHNSVTIAPTSTAWAGWDANKNLSANNFIEGYATTVSSTSPIVLTVASAYQQYITGSTAQTVTMPVTSTLANVATNAQSFLIVNISSNTTTVNSSGGNLIVSLPPLSQSVITCILNSGTTASSWSSNFDLNTAGVSSIAGTTNQIIASASTGAVTLSLPQSIATTSAVTFGSVAFSTTTQGIVGTTTNDNASSGYVGEFKDTGLIGRSSFVSSGTTSNLTSFSLTAGDWDVSFQAVISVSASASISDLIGGIQTTSAGVSSGVGAGQFFIAFAAVANPYTITQVGELRVSLATTTTIYLTGSATYTGTAPTYYCQMTARRVR